MRSAILRAFGLLLIAGAFFGAWLWNDMQATLREPLSVPTEQVYFIVRPGMTLRAIAEDLAAHGLWRHPTYLILEAHRRGFASRIQSGEYSVRRGMTVDGLLQMLVAGRVAQHPVIIVEGWTFAQIRDALEREPSIVNTLRGLDDVTLMARVGHSGVHPEGRFFPDTYYVTAGTSDVALLQRAYLRMEKVLAGLWPGRSGDLPYQSPVEALILASIVEKETALTSEQPVIAGVFLRRLKLGMKLQTDPTVIYGLGIAFDGNLRRQDLERDTPYNTYTREGLPPTPIATPGRAAIMAALHPAAGEALYFVARGDGSHQFSKTLDEHNRAVAQFQMGQPVPHR